MWNHLLNLFFPKSCAGCKSLLLGNENVICTECRHEIPLTNHHKIEHNEIFQKFYGRIPLEYGSALFYFHKKGIVQEMVHQLKYKGQYEIGETIGNWYSEELRHLEQPGRRLNNGHWRLHWYRLFECKRHRFLQPDCQFWRKRRWLATNDGHRWRQ